MSQEMKKMTLENIGDGAALEKVQYELDRVIDNILDPNTDPKKARVITLKITIKPDPSRDKFLALIDCASKLAAPDPHTARGFIGKEKGKGVAFHFDTPKQEPLDLHASISLIKKEG